MYNYGPYFPYSKPRVEQKTAIEFALDGFIKNKKRFIVIEAGTGVGKSAIGFTVARYLVDNNIDCNPVYERAAYYLTTQKILQKQYMKDFEKKGMLSLKSSSNYRCKYYKTKTFQEARRELKASSDDRFKASCAASCNYVLDKTKFISGYVAMETMRKKKVNPNLIGGSKFINAIKRLLIRSCK